MVNITLSIPNDLKEKMDQFSEINWSEVARSSIRQKIAQLSFLKGFTSDSDITLEDAEELGKEVSKLLVRRYKVTD